MSWRRFSQGLALAAALTALAAGQAEALASSSSPFPQVGKIFLGVSDRGSKEGDPEYGVNQFNAFAKMTGKVHLGTKKVVREGGKEKEVEVIKPEQIALGAGDEYLLSINKFFADHKLPAFIRPLGEPNRGKNLWSTYTEQGKPRGKAHTQYWYIQAFRRIYAIVHGGRTIKELNAVLAGIKLPPLKSKLPLTTRLPQPPVAIVWSTLTAGSPETKGNYPGDFWPGERWVDLVAPDFYPDQEFHDLNHLYSRPYLRNEPFGLAEWGVKEENPTFARDVIEWALKRRSRVKVLVYYEGFENEIFNLVKHTETAKEIRRRLQSPYFLTYAKPNGGSLPPLTPRP